MKKERAIVTFSVLLAVLTVGMLFAAAAIAFANADDFQFGGLIGELLEGKNGISSDAIGNETEPDSLEGLVTDGNHTQEFPYEDTTDADTVSDPIGLPTLRFFLGGCDAWTDNVKTQEFIEPGKASEWDHKAMIEGYNAEYVEIWGWAALFEEAPMQLGYKIDDGQSIYDDSAEFYNAPESSTTAALGMGAVSATGMRVRIPVENLSGTHTVEILVRHLGGNEGTICTFEIQIAETPNT